MIFLVRKTAITATLGVVALIATGCGSAASTPASVAPVAVAPSPGSLATSKPNVERKADPNDQACISFARNHNLLADLMINGKGSLTPYEFDQAQLDTVEDLDVDSLTAEGEIADRMKAAVALIPVDPREMVGTTGWRIGEEYNRAIVRVHTACEVDGVAYAMKEIPLAPEIFRR